MPMPVIGKRRVILIGVGGATCSGKTTLAKYLQEVLPNSFIIHQDDFCPPQELIPIHPLYNVQDWDSPEGCIDWERLVSFLARVRETGAIPEDHRSHDHLNAQREVPVDGAVLERWRGFFEDEERRQAGIDGSEVVWGLVDGFLLYWNMDVVSQLDVRVLLRESHDVLKQRRHERHGYHTAVQSDPEGALWRDPPNYWEQIVWPAYVEAHREVFVDGDVEHGKVDNGKVEGLTVVEAMTMTMGEMLDVVCEKLKEEVIRSV